jgi:hypothetical protein
LTAFNFFLQFLPFFPILYPRGQPSQEAWFFCYFEKLIKKIPEGKMTQPNEEKRYDVFLVAGKYDPISQEPSNPRLIISESNLKLLFTQKTGIQYIPKRWLQHENMKYDIPHLILHGNILGMIVPSLELEHIRNVREKIVLIGSLPAPCFKHSRYPELIDASRNFERAWENLGVAYADLINQLEIAKKKEDSS